MQKAGARSARTTCIQSHSHTQTHIILGHVRISPSPNILRGVCLLSEYGVAGTLFRRSAKGVKAGVYGSDKPDDDQRAGVRFFIFIPQLM